MACVVVSMSHGMCGGEHESWTHGMCDLWLSSLALKPYNPKSYCLSLSCHSLTTLVSLSASSAVFACLAGRASWLARV